jgi:tryptophanase
LYRDYGIRGVEIGSLMFGGPDPATGEEVVPALELVRLAIPRRVYTEAQLAYVGSSVIEVHRGAAALKGLRITHGAPFLRHFTAALEEVPAAVPA